MKTPQTHPSAPSSIEPLEARIAPAVIISPVDPKIATYTDLDGDKVTIKTSLGTFNNSVFTTMTKPLGDQLLLINLSGGGFDDAHLTVSVVKAPGGDGLANIGAINSTGHDLGAVVIPGDLGQLDAGDTNTADGGVKSLTVRSMGLFGLATQLVTGDLTSTISGRLGALKTTSDFKDALLFVSAGGLGSVTIGGSLIGGAGDFQGTLRINGDIGPIHIGRDLIGGGSDSGQILSIGGNIASVKIGGSLLGGPEGDSGLIGSGGTMGPVRIVGDVVGNLGASSGKISASGKITSLSIGGSLLGGDGPGSGVVQGNADLGPVAIGGNLKGGGNGAGEITAGGKITSVTISGSLLGGTGPNSGLINSGGDLGFVKIGFDVKGGTGDESGKIDVGGKLGSVSIGGSLLGSSGSYDTLVVNNITHRGQIFALGGIGAVKIGGDVLGASGRASGTVWAGANDPTISIGSVAIGGSLVGGGGRETGAIHSQGSIGPVTIAHSIVGGSANDAGGVRADGGALGNVTIGGSLIGGSGNITGFLFGRGPVGTIVIKGDVIGGAGFSSGFIQTGSSLAKVSIGGSLIGGTENSSGYIASDGALGAVSIGHDLLGGSIPAGGASLDASGYIESQDRIGSVFIGGSIISGTDGGGVAAVLTKNASIRAGRDIGTLAVRGGLIGNAGPSGDSPVIISAFGKTPVAGMTTDLAIGKISIGGRVEWANILAGYDPNLVPVNADAQIGSVTVGADWIASSIVAGVQNLGFDGAAGGTGTNADNVNFGNFLDQKIPEGGELAGVNSRIASITIAGQVVGTPFTFRSSDNFGFVAEQIGALKVGVRTFALEAGAGNDGFRINARADGIQSDAALHEIGETIASSVTATASAKLVNASTVTYQDADGDRVTVKFSKPLLTTEAIARNVFQFDTGLVNDGVLAAQQLRFLDLRPLVSSGLGVTFTVVRSGTGDGLVHVGAIESAGFDVGAVSIPGDLGRIDAGGMHTNANELGLKSLTVRTLGRLGLDTQVLAGAGFTPSLQSDIAGGLGALTVRQDLAEAFVNVSGSIGPVTIGGSLIGGDAIDSGAINATGAIGAVKIGLHLQGGFGQGSGAIVGSGVSGIASLSVGGSMLGAGGIGSGATFGGVTGFVTVGHNVRGGTNNNAGTIGIENGGTVTVGGSIVGGSGGFGARIVSDSAIGAVKVAHNVVGGSAERTARIEGSSIASFTVGGSLLGGLGATSGSVTSYSANLGPVRIGHDVIGGEGAESGKIDSGAKLASVSIGGSLLGGSGPDSGRVESATDTTAVSIGENLRGGAGPGSGVILAAGKLQAVAIGGSLLGGTADRAGSIFATLEIGAVKVGGDVAGGTMSRTGLIEAQDKIGPVSIAGSLIGGNAAGTSNSGAIYSSSGTLGAVTIGRDAIGGAAGTSAWIEASEDFASLTIGGSLIGGSGGFSGVALSVAGDLGPVKIGRNLIGGSIAGSASLFTSGYLESGESLASVSVGGSIFAGWDTSTGALGAAGSIRVGDDLGALDVKGSLQGNATSPVVISARGQATPVGNTDVAIGKISIGGRVERANILGGYSIALTPTNDGVQIGPVTVGGNWIASNLVAGVVNLGADDSPGGTGANADGVNFGDTHDFFIGFGSIFTRIASIVIGGVVAGTAASGDHFGFSSVNIGSFKSLNFTAPLNAAPNVIALSPTTGDVTLREP